MTDEYTYFNQPLYPESVNDETVVMWSRFLADKACVLCGGIEGCSHTVRQRARATIERGVP
jgi:hypothetical protein